MPFASTAPDRIFAGWWRTMLMCGSSGGGLNRVIVQRRRKPFIGIRQRHILAPRIILDLIASNLADGEVLRLRMREIESAHRRRGPHGVALGQRNAELRG